MNQKYAQGHFEFLKNALNWLNDNDFFLTWKNLAIISCTM